MKLTIELYNTRYSIEENQEDFDANQLKSLFNKLLVAAGFPPSVMGEEDGSWEWVSEGEMVIKKEEICAGGGE